MDCNAVSPARDVLSEKLVRLQSCLTEIKEIAIAIQSALFGAKQAEGGNAPSICCMNDAIQYSNDLAVDIHKRLMQIREGL